MCWINMNKNYLVIGCAGFAVLAVSAGAGPSRSLETGRAAGYYTHSGDGSRSAKARFERFKERHSPSGSTASVSVTGEDGKKYEVDIEDPEAKARAARKAWEKRQGAKARTFVNQAEQDARAKISSREVEQKALLGAMQKLKLAVEAKKVDDILAGKLVEVLSRRVKQGTMSRMQAAEAIKYLIANNKVNVPLE